MPHSETEIIVRPKQPRKPKTTILYDKDGKFIREEHDDGKVFLDFNFHIDPVAFEEYLNTMDRFRSMWGTFNFRS